MVNLQRNFQTLVLVIISTFSVLSSGALAHSVPYRESGIAPHHVARVLTDAGDKCSKSMCHAPPPGVAPTSSAYNAWDGVWSVFKGVAEACGSGFFDTIFKTIAEPKTIQSKSHILNQCAIFE